MYVGGTASLPQICVILMTLKSTVAITFCTDTHSATREKGNCNKWQITLGVSIPAAIAMGAVVECVVRALYRYHNKNDPLPIKTLKGKQTNNESL